MPAAILESKFNKSPSTSKFKYKSSMTIGLGPRGTKISSVVRINHYFSLNSVGKLVRCVQLLFVFIPICWTV